MRGLVLFLSCSALLVAARQISRDQSKAALTTLSPGGTASDKKCIVRNPNVTNVKTITQEWVDEVSKCAKNIGTEPFIAVANVLYKNQLYYGNDTAKFEADASCVYRYSKEPRRPKFLELVSEPKIFNDEKAACDFLDQAAFFYCGALFHCKNAGMLAEAAYLSAQIRVQLDLEQPKEIVECPHNAIKVEINKKVFTNTFNALEDEFVLSSGCPNTQK